MNPSSAGGNDLSQMSRRVMLRVFGSMMNAFAHAAIGAAARRSLRDFLRVNITASIHAKVKRL